MISVIRKIKGYGISKSLRFAIHELYRFFYFRLIRDSYALEGEDLIISHLVGSKNDGIYVDVGACDPTRLSNTKRFYKRGWRGINIDPNPESIEKFQRQRPRDINVNSGVGPEVSSDLEFFVMFPPTVSTFSKKFRDMNVKMGCVHEKTIQIKCRSLAKILDENLPSGQKIDFLSIDAEGYDFEVLKSNDWSKYLPRVICVECPTHLNEMNRHCEIFEQQQFLLDKGYQLVLCNGMDCFYLYVDHLEKNLAAPEVAMAL